MNKNKKTALKDVQALKEKLLLDLDKMISVLGDYNNDVAIKEENKKIKNILDKIDNKL